MATVLIYNDVIFYNVVTRRWSHEMVYDDSGTDLIGERLSISVDGIIHAQRTPVTDSVAYVTASSPGSQNVATATSSFRVIEDLLKMPRRRLQVYFGATDTLDPRTKVVDVNAPLDPGSGSYGGIIGTDIDNGPKPRRVELFSIVGNAAFRVRFEIDVMVGDCKRINQQNIVVSNKWRLTEDMNSDFYCTRRIDGKLRLALSKRRGGTFPSGHGFKALTMPVLEPGFRRESISFTSEENGLNCSYSVVDRQVHYAAPWPATDMEVVHEEATTDGTHYLSGVTIRLTGAPHTDKRLLIERATQIVEQRLDFTTRSPSEPEQIITRAGIRDYIGKDNVIEMDLQVMQVPKEAAFLTRLRKEKLGVPLELPALSITTETPSGGQTTTTTSEIPGTEYDPRFSPLPQLYGYTPHEGERRLGVLMLLHCFLQEPCLLNSQRGIYAGETIETASENDPRERETTIRDLPPGSLQEDTDDDHYSEGARAAVYTMSKISNKYVTNRMLVQMPFSKIIPIQNQNNPTCVIFDLAEPQACRIIEIDIERAGAPPKIPGPLDRIADGTLIQVLKHKDETIYPPVLTADGRHEVFRVVARYEYILSRPPLSTEQLRLGTHPYTKDLTASLSQLELYDASLA
jgi:hypothetical protein